MILKWLVTAFIVYAVVKWIIRPKQIGTSQRNSKKINRQESNPKEGEYIDYEEVE